MSKKTAAPRRRYVRFTRWRRAHFLRVLEETGHAQMAAEAAGVSLGCIYRLRRLEPGSPRGWPPPSRRRTGGWRRRRRDSH